MKIGNLILENPLFLAPMAGVTDKAFRMITKPFGPAMMYTEMVSGKGLHYKSQRTAQLLHAEEAEGPVAAQIFGHEPEIMGSIAEEALRFGAVMVDINMGCPAPKIVKNGDGSALMKNPDLAGEVIAAVVRAVNVPVTVKIRKGWDDGSVNAVEMAKTAEQNGAAAVTIHGRTREQFYSGKADLDIIRQVKRAVSIPVIGNGDITDGVSAAKMMEETGCDGLMIGRAAQGNPWIFSQVLAYLQDGTILPPPSAAERVAVAKKHLSRLVLYKGEHRGIQEGRKHMAWYFKGVKGGAHLRDAFHKANTLAQMTDILDAVLDREL